MRTVSHDIVSLSLFLTVKVDPERKYAHEWIPDLNSFVTVGTVVDY